MSEPARPADSPPKTSADIPGSNIQPQYVNRFQVVRATDHVRFIFGDATIGLDATYHSAVVMSLSDAVALTELLVSLVKQQVVAGVGTVSFAGSSQAIAMGIADTKKAT